MFSCQQFNVQPQSSSVRLDHRASPDHGSVMVRTTASMAQMSRIVSPIVGMESLGAAMVHVCHFYGDVMEKMIVMMVQMSRGAVMLPVLLVDSDVVIIYVFLYIKNVMESLTVQMVWMRISVVSLIWTSKLL